MISCLVVGKNTLSNLVMIRNLMSLWKKQDYNRITDTRQGNMIALNQSNK